MAVAEIRLDALAFARHCRSSMANERAKQDVDLAEQSAAEILDALRECNRLLLVCAGANVPPAIADALNVARDNVARAIRLLSPVGPKTPPEELPPAEFRRLAESAPAASHFRDELGDGFKDQK